MALLELDQLAVRYGNVHALNGVSLSVHRGGALAVLGRNGAGKSSLLNTVAGLQRPASGRIAFNGDEISRIPPAKRSRMGISLVAEGKRIFPNLTVFENLRLGGFNVSRASFGTAIEHVYEFFPDLADRSDQLAGRLSGGQQQMLTIGRALISEPQLLLLDEPSMGLAPKVAREVYERLSTLRSAGVTLVLVEQQVERVLGLVDDVLVLSLGHVVLTERADALSREDPRLKEAYIGTGGGA